MSQNLLYIAWLSGRIENVIDVRTGVTRLTTRLHIALNASCEDLHYKTSLRPALLVRLSLLLVAVFALIGCAQYSRREGWLTNRTTKLERSLPDSQARTQNAFVFRDNVSNRLDVMVQQNKDENVLSSVVPKSYSVLLTYTTRQRLPKSISRVFLPFATGEHFSLERSSVDLSAHHVILEISCDRLGLDYLSAALFSPQGLPAVAYFRSSDLALSLMAKADQPWFRWGSVYTPASSPHQSLVLRNEVEYPMIVEKLEYTAGGIHQQLVIDQKLKAHSDLVVTLPQKLADVEFGTFAVTAIRQRSVPINSFLSRYYDARKNDPISSLDARSLSNHESTK